MVFCLEQNIIALLWEHTHFIVQLNKKQYQK